MALTTDEKLKRQMKFPPEFEKKVDVSKVNLDLIRKWMVGKLEALGVDDDIVPDAIFNYLDIPSKQPDIKQIQLYAIGLIPEHGAAFCKELWRLLLSAQESPSGVAQEMVEAKKAELKKQEAEKEKRRRDQEDIVDGLRRSYDERPGGGRGRGSGFRGARADRNDRRGYRRDSRSPPRDAGYGRSRRGSPPRRRGFDSYMPDNDRERDRHRDYRDRRGRRNISRDMSEDDRRRGRDRRDRRDVSYERRHSRSLSESRSPVRRTRRDRSFSGSRSNYSPPPKRSHYSRRSASPRRGSVSSSRPHRDGRLSRSISRSLSRSRATSEYRSPSIRRSEASIEANTPGGDTNATRVNVRLDPRGRVADKFELVFRPKFVIDGSHRFVSDSPSSTLNNSRFTIASCLDDYTFRNPRLEWLSWSKTNSTTTLSSKDESQLWKSADPKRLGDQGTLVSGFGFEIFRSLLRDAPEMPDCGVIFPILFSWMHSKYEAREVATMGYSDMLPIRCPSMPKVSKCSMFMYSYDPLHRSLRMYSSFHPNDQNHHRMQSHWSRYMACGGLVGSKFELFLIHHSRKWRSLFDYYATQKRERILDARGPWIRVVRISRDAR